MGLISYMQQWFKHGATKQKEEAKKSPHPLVKDCVITPDARETLYIVAIARTKQYEEALSITAVEYAERSIINNEKVFNIQISNGDVILMKHRSICTPNMGWRECFVPYNQTNLADNNTFGGGTREVNCISPESHKELLTAIKNYIGSDE